MLSFEKYKGILDLFLYISILVILGADLFYLFYKYNLIKMLTNL